MINRLLLRLKRPRPNNDSVKRRFGNKTNQSPSLMPGAAHKGGSVICGDYDYGDRVGLADPRQPAYPTYYRPM
ncbi:MAG: hypothetical protein ACRDC6_23730, partial [Shewanella sp.]